MTAAAMWYLWGWFSGLRYCSRDVNTFHRLQKDIQLVGGFVNMSLM